MQLDPEVGLGDPQAERVLRTAEVVQRFLKVLVGDDGFGGCRRFGTGVTQDPGDHAEGGGVDWERADQSRRHPAEETSDSGAGVRLPDAVEDAAVLGFPRQSVHLCLFNQFNLCLIKT